jgi:hypothetical protein
VARVVLSSECAAFTGGGLDFEIEAETVRGLIDELDRRYPRLGAFIDQRMAFAIDGVIHQDAWFAKIGRESEVFLIPRIGGG